ncbi:MAG: mechanosensitive ion channel [Myxococcota bacterium]|nr:mechanosensitive ion channel [Myxococcota bacterium]
MIGNLLAPFGRSALLGLTLLLLAAPYARPQSARPQSPPQVAPAPQNQIAESLTPTRGKPIPISEIGPESERTKGSLNEVLLSIQPDGTFEAIILGLPDVLSDIEVTSEQSQQIQELNASVSDLDRLARDWDPIMTQLTRFEGRLDRRVRRVDEAMVRIGEQRRRWAATRRALEGQQVSGEVILQIDEVDAAIRDAVERANTQQAAGVRLQSDVARLEQQVEEYLASIALARQIVVSRVFMPDSPPAWSSEIWQTLTGKEIGNNLEALRNQYTEAQNKFLAAEGQKSLLFFFLTLGLVVSMFALRKRINDRLRLEEDVEALRGMFSRPISLGILLAFVASLGIFSGSLRTLEYILSAMAVLPAVLILRQILDRPFYPALNITLAIYFLENTRAIFIGFPVFSRVLFLLEMGFLMVCAVIWIWRTSERNPAKPESQVMDSFIGRLSLKTILLASGVALVANAAGYTFLSRLVGTALAFAIYGSVVLYGSSRVLAGLASLAMSARPLNRLGMVRRNRGLLLGRFRLATMVVFGWFWVRAVLIRLELWPSLIQTWKTLVATEVPLPQISITLGDLLASGLVFYGSLLFSRFLRFSLDEDIYPRLQVRTGRSNAISTLLQYIILVFGFAFAAAALGFDANRFTLLAGAFGVGIGFGLQTIVNNFISGIILLTEQPIQVGDTIEMGPVFGEVQRIGIRSSTVRSFQGAEIIVPNADLISQQVTNWTLSDRKRRIEIPVGVAYGSDPNEVLGLLAEVTKNSAQILPTPEPYTLFTGFGDSSLNFEVRAWTDNFDQFLRVKSAVSVGISEALAEAGITIPFPQRDLHVRTLAGDKIGAAPESDEPPSSAS